jgi:hypothetical protein
MRLKLSLLGYKDIDRSLSFYADWSEPKEIDMLLVTSVLQAIVDNLIKTVSNNTK